MMQTLFINVIAQMDILAKIVNLQIIHAVHMVFVVTVAFV
jgi:hypothetical protein